VDANGKVTISNVHLTEGYYIITETQAPAGYMFDAPQQQERAIERRIANSQPLIGYGWPAMQVRWCTGQLKTHLIDKEANRLKQKHQVRHYIGIAADEAHRCKELCYPLVDWGITEAEALQICYDRGFHFGGLYQIYRRASCWCCPLQRIGELRKLRQHHPELWARLRELDARAIEQFKGSPLGCFKDGWSVEELEQRFYAEDMQLSLFDDMPQYEQEEVNTHGC